MGGWVGGGGGGAGGGASLGGRPWLLLGWPPLGAPGSSTPPDPPAAPCTAQVPYEPKPKVEDEEFQAAEAAAAEVGARCEVEGGKRGVVRYVGKCEGLPLGHWVGVQVRARRSCSCCC